MPFIKRQLFPSQSKYSSPTCGIYEIRHIPSERRYVGSSMEVENRIYWHLIMLRKGKHHCRYLQNVWNKYNEDEFKFYLLESCSIDQLETREQWHMDRTAKGKSMNTHPAAGSGRGFKMPPAAIEKMKASAQKIARSTEGRKQRSDQAKHQHAIGRARYRTPIQSKERQCTECGKKFLNCRKPNGQLSQRKLCEECKANYKAPGPGPFKHTLEARQKISEASKAMWRNRK